MLTCKVGKNIVNTLDYLDEQIRKWSKKGILKCPVCDGNMIYRNGFIKVAHFAHEKDECNLGYWENETKEHAQGKVILYNMLKNQSNVDNLKLEAWIPETKQRPDVYFEINGGKFVLEFQCSPITVKELRERRALYKLNNITDIWILGRENYYLYEYSPIIDMESSRSLYSYCTKAIERDIIENYTSFNYLNVDNELVYLVLEATKITDVIKYDYMYYLEDVKKCFLDYKNFCISSNSIIEKETIKQEQAESYRLAEIKRKEKVLENKSKLNDLVVFLNEIYKKIDTNYMFEAIRSISDKYLFKVHFYNGFDDLTFYIKDNSTDCCNHRKGFFYSNGKRRLGLKSILINKLEYRAIDILAIKDFIWANSASCLRNHKYKV